MPSTLQAREVLNREFLEIRAKLLQLAAHLDRIERGTGDADFEKIGLIHQALDVLKNAEIGPRRAEKVQLLFSREYDPEWKTNLGITPAQPGR